MSIAPVEEPGAEVRDNLGVAFRALQHAAGNQPFPEYRERKVNLEKLQKLVKERRDQITDAISDDFGHRSRHESLTADVYLVVSNIRYILKHLRGWMAPEPRPVTLALQPARARVVPQPVGVVGVISPWNYPVQLALVPLAYALAAGNRVMLKPSELTPRTSELMCELLAEIYPADLVSVAVGGSDVGVAFAELPFDHLFFTGSPRVGREVMRAAARNLTPVTLELGGKSPVLVHPDYPTAEAARAIASSKLFNAGQTCVSPDYVVIRRDQANAFVDALTASIAELYPKLVDNPDYTSIINHRHAARVAALLDDAESKGATVVRINPGCESFDDAGNKMAPAIVRSPTDEMVVMQEEIFGPVLPIVEVDTVEEGIAYVRKRPRPLALYVFDKDMARVDELLKTTHAGGVSVNECMLHAADENLPFGGTGPSGMGAYHGREGFDALSHRKAVFYQPRFNTRFLVTPPYGRAIERLLDFLT